jgi:hypothetical protein
MTGLQDHFAAPDRFAGASEQLHELVARQLGADDFGPDDYLPGLKTLLLSLDYDPRLTERGRRIAWGELNNALFARAHAIRAIKATPAVDAIAIKEPVVITGIPRTGTTALHKLLALDPQFQGLQTWLIGAPMPRPPREAWEHNPQFLKTVEQLSRRYEAVPDRQAAHRMAAEEVDECCLVLRQGFVSNIWSCMWSASTYDLWCQTQSELHCYEHLRRVMQLISSSEPQKRWLLKNPGHIANLDLLFTLFPDAKVIQTHRDPARAIPSLCAMLIRNHDVVEEGRRELRARILGLRETEKWAKALRDAEPVRRAHGKQLLDVIHSDFHRAPMQTIERIYSFVGLDLTAPARAAMEKRVKDDPERQYGVHQYRIDDFGITEEQVRERFGDYTERFGLVTTKPATAEKTR